MIGRKRILVYLEPGNILVAANVVPRFEAGERNEKEKEGRGKERKKKDGRDGRNIPNKFLATVLIDL